MLFATKSSKYDDLIYQNVGLSERYPTRWRGRPGQWMSSIQTPQSRKLLIQSEGPKCFVACDNRLSQSANSYVNIMQETCLAEIYANALESLWAEHNLAVCLF